MSEQIQISMVNTRGRVVWVDQQRVAGLREQGWRVIVNPKESYYPQYDESQGKVREDEIGNMTKVIDSEYKNKLGIIVI